jgi:intein/homing endonuclease
MSRGLVLAKCQIRLTAELAYVLGWILGDGYVNKREVDAIVSLREQSLIEPVVRRELERFGTVFVVPRHGTLVIQCNCTLLSRALCSPRGARYWENVDFILRLPKYASAFIAGFWDADGGIYRESNGTVRSHLYNSRLHVLNKIADSMQTLYGIETMIYKRKKNNNSSTSKIHQRLDRFDLYVRARSNKRWARQISRFMLLPWKKPVA